MKGTTRKQENMTSRRTIERVGAVVVIVIVIHCHSNLTGQHHYCGSVLRDVMPPRCSVRGSLLAGMVRIADGGLLY
jgi:hypothetical protein